MRYFFIILTSVSLIGAVGFFSMPAIKEMRRSAAIEDEINDLKREAEKINADNGFLRNQVEYLQSDHYKERLAKDKLNLRNPGERVVVVQPVSGNDETLKDENASKESGPVEERKSEELNFKKWINYFLK